MVQQDGVFQQLITIKSRAQTESIAAFRGKVDKIKMRHRLCWQCDAGLSAGPPQYEYENWHTSAWICPECKSIFVGLSELCNGSF